MKTVFVVTRTINGKTWVYVANTRGNAIKIAVNSFMMSWYHDYKEWNDVEFTTEDIFTNYCELFNDEETIEISEEKIYTGE
jgi:hypothetical protein